ncbi:hypothetical protein FXO37_14293 [Capsicum annuum]|nr:hypothetical protein FXO37_14293 [Capsicum annuum]
MATKTLGCSAQPFLTNAPSAMIKYQQGSEDIPGHLRCRIMKGLRLGLTFSNSGPNGGRALKSTLALIVDDALVGGGILRGRTMLPLKSPVDAVIISPIQELPSPVTISWTSIKYSCDALWITSQDSCISSLLHLLFLFLFSKSPLFSASFSLPYVLQISGTSTTYISSMMRIVGFEEAGNGHVSKSSKAVFKTVNSL